MLFGFVFGSFTKCPLGPGVVMFVLIGSDCFFSSFRSRSAGPLVFGKLQKRGRGRKMKRERRGDREGAQTTADLID